MELVAYFQELYTTYSTPIGTFPYPSLRVASGSPTQSMCHILVAGLWDSQQGRLPGYYTASHKWTVCLAHF